MSVPSESLPIIIIGAGISGLSLACLLEHYQIPFQIYDTLPRSYTQGYSISLRSWAFKPLLDVFGRNEAQLRAATATDALIGGKGDIHNMIRDAQTGDNLMVLRGGEGTYFRCNRSFLRDFFLERISPERVHFEWELCDVISDGDSVTATFENGEVVRGRLLIAADGVHSKSKSISLLNVWKADAAKIHRSPIKVPFQDRRTLASPFECIRRSKSRQGFRV